jgi:hypothetical protein
MGRNCVLSRHPNGFFAAALQLGRDAIERNDRCAGVEASGPAAEGRPESLDRFLSLAYASATGYSLVTFDQGIKRYGDAAVKCLG